MSNIAKIDKNLAVVTSIDKEGLVFYDAESEPFKIYGVFKENGWFRRMPQAVAQEVSEGVYNLHTHGAGGRVRFVTDSPYVAIQTVYRPGKMPHFAFSGSCGFDLYVESDSYQGYTGTFMPPLDVKDGYESVVNIWGDSGYVYEKERKERVVTIHFPLYSSVKSLYIGVEEGSVLKEAPAYTLEKPVVYYGSSITQGGCASKPGSSYQSIISRRFDCNYINLGFSGNGKAEDVMVDYIKELDMSAFVMDYDFNAPDAEYLQATHRKMFEKIREAHPLLPIIILPRPRYYSRPDDVVRRKIIYATYQAAKEKGDQRVWFIDGAKLMELVKDNGTVDGTHPTDSGFVSMAKAIGDVLEEIIKGRLYC